MVVGDLPPAGEERLAGRGGGSASNGVPLEPFSDRQDRGEARAEAPARPRGTPPERDPTHRERESFFLDNLLVRIHLFNEMVLVDRSCAMGI